MTGGLEHAKILICNDDGIDAKGIKVLEQAARSLSDDVWVVAPAAEQSGKAHAFTARGTICAERRDERHFAVTGTPTDCMLYALEVLFRDEKPAFVFSGINHGANLGFDVVYSGTAGAAIEGTLHGIKSYAFSLSGAKKESQFWGTAAELIPSIVAKTAFEPWPELWFLNVNIPACSVYQVKGVKVVPFSSQKIGDVIEIVEKTQEHCLFNIGYARQGTIEPHSDTQVVADGFVSLTPVSLHLADTARMPALQALF